MFQLETSVVINAFLSWSQLKGNVNMVINQLLWLYYILLLDFRHVVWEILQIHVLIFPVHDVLDLIQLSCRDSSQSWDTNISDFFEDKVFIGQFKINGSVSFKTTCLECLLTGVQNLILNFQVCGVDSKSLIKLTLVVLLDTEWWNEINWSIHKQKTVDLCFERTPSHCIVDHSSRGLGILESLENKWGNVTLCILVFNLA